MKTILLLTGVTILLATSGCLVSEGRGHGPRPGHSSGHWRHRGHSEVRVVAPVVVVPAVRVDVH